MEEKIKSAKKIKKILTSFKLNRELPVYINN